MEPNSTSSNCGDQLDVDNTTLKTSPCLQTMRCFPCSGNKLHNLKSFKLHGAHTPLRMVSLGIGNPLGGRRKLGCLSDSICRLPGVMYRAFLLCGESDIQHKLVSSVFVYVSTYKHMSHQPTTRFGVWISTPTRGGKRAFISVK